MAKKRKAPKLEGGGKVKRPRPTVATLETQNHQLNKHLNVCVARVNLLTEHVQFLHKKLLEQTRLYNREFRRLNDRCDEIEEPQLEKYKKFDPDIFGYFAGENRGVALEPTQIVQRKSFFEEEFMTEKELTDAIAEYAY